MNWMDWVKIIAVMMGIAGSVGSAGLWAGDQRWITQESMIKKEIRDLDREITQIEIKKRNDEATRSEADYVEHLKMQKRSLEQELK